MAGLRQLVSLLVSLAAVVALAPVGGMQPVSTGTSGGGSKTWIGRYQEVEEYLRTAECVQLEALGLRKAPEAPPALSRCTLRGGGPVSRLAWTSRPPGVYRGFRESYQFNIAAYELDKLLRLDMVPPAVERELHGRKGVAVFWVENISDLTKGAVPGASDRAHWDTEKARMMMFANLTGDRERNPGNLLRDSAWNLILIDHSRAFPTDTELPHVLNRIDEDLWDRIERLTRKQLDAALGPWLDADQIAAIIERREKMRAVRRARLDLL
jgi:hypothetical protein